jgi:pyruvate/2-oxoglutarate/acetoin dehydrogenase E1 component
VAEKTYLQAISDGLRQEMRRDQRVFVIGEDVGVYGGSASRRSSAPGA